jgi:hypothetical protein
MFNVFNANFANFAIFARSSSAPACLVILLVTFAVSNDRFGFSIGLAFASVLTFEASHL